MALPPKKIMSDCMKMLNIQGRNRLHILEKKNMYIVFALIQTIEMVVQVYF